MHGAQRMRHAFSFVNESERFALLEKSCVEPGEPHTPYQGRGWGGTAVKAFGQFGAVSVVPRSWLPSFFVPERLGVRKRKGEFFHVLLAFSFGSCRTPAAFVKPRPSPCLVPCTPCSAVLHTFIVSRPSVSPSRFIFCAFLWPGFFFHSVTMPRPLSWKRFTRGRLRGLASETASESAYT